MNSVSEEFKRAFNLSDEDVIKIKKEVLKDAKSWIEDVQDYIENVKNGKVSSKDSLNSLIKSGICDNEGNLTKPYKPLTLKQIQE